MAVSLGVAATSLLTPQAASALNFTFEFGGVSGLISGLSEGLNPCSAAQPSCKVEVLNAGITTAPTGIYEKDPNPGIAGAGFLVSQIGGGGIVMESAEWVGFNNAGPFGLLKFFNNSGLDEAELVGSSFPQEAGYVTFTLVPEAVPGPAPFLGAAAAFGYSRKLRKRIQASIRSDASSID